MLGVVGVVIGDGLGWGVVAVGDGDGEDWSGSSFWIRPGRLAGADPPEAITAAHSKASHAMEERKRSTPIPLDSPSETNPARSFHVREDVRNLPPPAPPEM